MEDYHIGDGKGVALKIFRVVDVETSVNILQCFTVFPLHGINHPVIILIHGKPLTLYPVKGHKTEVIGTV